MEIISTRKIFTEKSTISEWTVDGKFECYVLEDTDRGLHACMDIDKLKSIKIKGQTAIPYGRYQIVVTKSDRFSLLAGHDVYLPLLLKVPGFDGIRIHKGNKPEDTDGCQLPGLKHSMDMVSQSTEAFNALNQKINNALKKEQVWITIKK